MVPNRKVIATKGATSKNHPKAWMTTRKTSLIVNMATSMRMMTMNRGRRLEEIGRRAVRAYSTMTSS